MEWIGWVSLGDTKYTAPYDANKHCPYHHGNNHTCIISMIRIIIIVKHDQEKNKLTLDMANGQGGQGASLRKAATGMIISCASNFHIMQVLLLWSFYKAGG